MCIAIHKPANAKIPDAVLKQCYARNSDGAGLSYVKDGKLIVNKGFFNAKAIIRVIKEHEDKEMIIHFRVASPGMVIDKANCHPFFAASEGHEKRYKFAIIHNGRLPWAASKNRSDTSHFVEEMIQPIIDRDPWFFDNHETNLLMESFIGTGNKLVIMRYDCKEDKIKVYIINKKAGNEAHGCWFSNYSYIPTQVYTGAHYNGRNFGARGLDYEDEEFWQDRYANDYDRSAPPIARSVSGPVAGKKVDESVYGDYRLDRRSGQWVVVGSKEDLELQEKNEALEEAAAAEALKGTSQEGRTAADASGSAIEDGVDEDEGISKEEADAIGTYSDRMDYLTPDEKRESRRICATYLRSIGVEIKGLTTAEIVQMVADEVQETVVDMEKKTPEEVRRWILEDGEEFLCHQIENEKMKIR